MVFERMKPITVVIKRREVKQMKLNKKGFTLIELLVVIAIIGLLSTLAVVALNNARSKARDAKRVADVKNIQTALELYYTEASTYPNVVVAAGALELGTLSGSVDCTTACDTISSTNGIDEDAAGTTYMGAVPRDPSWTATAAECGATATAGCNYSYRTLAAATANSANQYCISFWLENATGGLTAGAAYADQNGLGNGACTT